MRKSERDELIEAVHRDNNFWSVVRWIVAGAFVIWWLLA